VNLIDQATKNSIEVLSFSRQVSVRLGADWRRILRDRLFGKGLVPLPGVCLGRRAYELHGYGDADPRGFSERCRYS
jgi:hypothetical protein